MEVAPFLCLIPVRNRTANAGRGWIHFVRFGIVVAGAGELYSVALLGRLRVNTRATFQTDRVQLRRRHYSKLKQFSFAVYERPVSIAPIPTPVPIPTPMPILIPLAHSRRFELDYTSCSTRRKTQQQ